jgi:hypothetical protein
VYLVAGGLALTSILGLASLHITLEDEKLVAGIYDISLTELVGSSLPPQQKRVVSDIPLISTFRSVYNWLRTLYHSR